MKRGIGVEVESRGECSNILGDSQTTFGLGLIFDCPQSPSSITDKPIPRHVITLPSGTFDTHNLKRRCYSAHFRRVPFSNQ
jgi:hypothetical protein